MQIIRISNSYVMHVYSASVCTVYHLCSWLHPMFLKLYFKLTRCQGLNAKSSSDPVLLTYYGLTIGECSSWLRDRDIKKVSISTIWWRAGFRCKLNDHKLSENNSINYWIAIMYYGKHVFSKGKWAPSPMPSGTTVQKFTVMNQMTIDISLLGIYYLWRPNNVLPFAMSSNDQVHFTVEMTKTSICRNYHHIFNSISCQFLSNKLVFPGYEQELSVESNTLH